MVMSRVLVVFPLNCRSKEDGTSLLTSKIECNTRARKNNELGGVYPKTIRNDKKSKNITYPEIIVTLKCEV